jgi:predicted nucleotidyltransferase
MKHHDIEIPEEDVRAFCRCNHIRRLSLFGSILRDDFNPQSDIDILVEFEPGHVAGLLRMAALERELTEMLGRRVDLRTAAELSRYFRSNVVRESELVHAEG